MKSVFKFNYFPVFALVLAGGMALATTSRTVAPQFFKDAAGEWQPLGSRQIGTLPGQYSCNESQTDCTAETYNDETGAVTGVIEGQLAQN